jgi:hypothetical protein
MTGPSSSSTKKDKIALASALRKNLIRRKIKIPATITSDKKEVKNEHKKK